MRGLILVILTALGTLLSLLYGIAHDFLTYLMSPEYYHQIRFPQYNISINEGYWGVAKVAIFNSWKIGLIISMIIAFTGLIHANNRKIFKYSIQAFLIVAFSTAILSGLGALIAIVFYYKDSIIGLEQHFKSIQTVHNFTYIGSIIGMFCGLYWHFYQRKSKANFGKFPMP